MIFVLTFFLGFFYFLLKYQSYVFKEKYSTMVIYSTENFVIINKQSDLKINSNNKSELTVQTFLKEKFPAMANKKLYHEFYFPHRLDYATSGILCVPMNKQACKIVSEVFSTRQSKKYYLALVRGMLSKEVLDINLSIGEDSREPKIQKMCSGEEVNFCIRPRTARTVVVALEQGIYDDYSSTKVLCRLITGRRHQIRVHCSSLGHTIVGDYTYSNRKDVKPCRMFLHAVRLVLPNSLETLDISTKDPFENQKKWIRVKTFHTLESGYSKVDLIVDSMIL